MTMPYAEFVRLKKQDARCFHCGFHIIDHSADDFCPITDIEGNRIQDQYSTYVTFKERQVYIISEEKI